ncbi:MAG: iron ABC transporter permease [Thermoplasmata archaeon]|nr:iron ABC transporter permease [Thermoplasmata archaeon]
MSIDAGSADLKEEYHRYILRKILFISVLLALIVFLSLFALTLGGREITFVQAAGALWNHITGNIPSLATPEGIDDYTVWEVRLPRVAIGIVAGAGLAIGGAAMQSAVKNPLADPYTTGISSGAVFGVAVALVLGFSVSSNTGNYGIVMNAFIFGMIPVAVISVLAKFTHSSPATMILAGVAMSYLFNAFSTLLLVAANTETLQAAYLWQIGTLENVNWGDFPLMCIVTIAGTAVLMLLSSKINLLTIGDASAKSLGLDPETLRIVILIILSVMTASIVGFIGIIGFIGLVSPHIVRLIMGADNRYLIPASALFGAAFLLIADLISRLIIYPGSIAVGVTMSFIGAPIFLFLIIRTRKEVW